MTGNTRPTSVGREIFLRFLKKPPLVVVTKVLTADTISIGAVSFRQKTAFLLSERETAPQNIGPNGYTKGDDESMRKIVLDMQSGIFASSKKIISFKPCMPNVKWSTWFHNHRRIGESIR